MGLHREVRGTSEVHINVGAIVFLFFKDSKMLQ